MFVLLGTNGDSPPLLLFLSSSIMNSAPGSFPSSLPASSSHPFKLSSAKMTLTPLRRRARLDVLQWADDDDNDSAPTRAPRRLRLIFTSPCHLVTGATSKSLRPRPHCTPRRLCCHLLHPSCCHLKLTAGKTRPSGRPPFDGNKLSGGPSPQMRPSCSPSWGLVPSMARGATTTGGLWPTIRR